MEVILAKHAGACYGVNRSLQLCMDAINESREVATLGQLIHNPLVVKELSQKYNVRVFDKVKPVESLVIRSHGVTVEDYSLANKLCAKVYDATCPHVKAVQTAASKMAKQYKRVLIIGKVGHPEVQSVRSYALKYDASVDVVQNVEAAKKLVEAKTFNNKTFGVVSQTTMSQGTVDNILSYLKDKGLSFVVANTICNATKQRQDAAKELSKVVDGFVVIGGKNSSNTTHLAQICSKHCKTLHIEKVSEINPDFLKDCVKIGVSAGASTPFSQIESVVSYLKSF